MVNTYEDMMKCLLNFCNILLVWCWVLEHLKNLFLYVVNLKFIDKRETRLGAMTGARFTTMRKRDFVWSYVMVAKTAQQWRVNIINLNEYIAKEDNIPDL